MKRQDHNRRSSFSFRYKFCRLGLTLERNSEHVVGSSTASSAAVLKQIMLPWRARIAIANSGLSLNPVERFFSQSSLSEIFERKFGWKRFDFRNPAV